MLQRLPVARSKLSEIPARLCQTQRTVRATTHFVGVMTVLTVVLPETHRTNLVTSPPAQGEIPAARTTIRRLLLCRLADILNGHGAKWSNSYLTSTANTLKHIGQSRLGRGLHERDSILSLSTRRLCGSTCHERTFAEPKECPGSDDCRRQNYQKHILELPHRRVYPTPRFHDR